MKWIGANVECVACSWLPFISRVAEWFATTVSLTLQPFLAPQRSSCWLPIACITSASTTCVAQWHNGRVKALDSWFHAQSFQTAHMCMPLDSGHHNLVLAKGHWCYKARKLTWHCTGHVSQTDLYQLSTEKLVRGIITLPSVQWALCHPLSLPFYLYRYQELTSSCNVFYYRDHCLCVLL